MLSRCFLPHDHYCVLGMLTNGSHEVLPCDRAEFSRLALTEITEPVSISVLGGNLNGREGDVSSTYSTTKS